MKLILASGSPRRFELLSEAGFRFEVVVPNIVEDSQPGEAPAQLVSRLSLEKAQHVAASHPEAWVLGADTIVTLDNDILGKPEDKQDASLMLARLSNREHTVFTGFSLVCMEQSVSYSHVDSSVVKLRELSSADIKWYVETGEPLDKAGSYGIQRVGAQFIERVGGSYTAIVGLNICAVAQILHRYGIRRSQ